MAVLSRLQFQQRGKVGCDGELQAVTQACPICGTTVNENLRYPRYLCATCSANVTDAEGRELRLFRRSPDGRFAASYEESGETYDSHEVYVMGIRCWADEARFGGIVVQAQ